MRTKISQMRFISISCLWYVKCRSRSARCDMLWDFWIVWPLLTKLVDGCFAHPFTFSLHDMKDLENASMALKRVLEDKNEPGTTAPVVNWQNGTDPSSHSAKTTQLNIQEVIRPHHLHIHYWDSSPSICWLPVVLVLLLSLTIKSTLPQVAATSPAVNELYDNEEHCDAHLHIRSGKAPWDL